MNCRVEKLVFPARLVRKIAVVEDDFSGGDLVKPVHLAAFFAGENHGKFQRGVGDF